VAEGAKEVRADECNIEGVGEDEGQDSKVVMEAMDG
jgi:hypothetical protein